VQAEVGAVELWRNDPRVTPDMTLADGYYGATPGSFEAASTDTYLERGTGLPGLAWQHEASVYFADLSNATAFPRAAAAASAGIRSGMAFPCPVPGRENYAVSLLWPSAVPAALRIESWIAPVADSAGTEPVLAYGFDADGATTSASAVPDVVLQALATGLPGIAPTPGPGYHGVLALPIAIDGVVTEVLAFTL
jgi:hypothetical protein